MEMVQDLLPAAINDAMAKAKALHVEMMQEFTGDMPMPAGFDDMLKQMSGLQTTTDQQDADTENQNTENEGESK
jgi:hypothetical protein